MGAPSPVPGSTQMSQAAHTSPLVESLVGALLLDRFRVIEPLGVGGMAMVFLAEHVTLHKKCAIKVLLPEHNRKPNLVERFLQEARAASMIDHENVVEITDYGTAPNGSVFFVMELLAGEDLADKLAREGRMDWPHTRAIVLQICRALAAAHARGVVHRDMKPENVFLVRRHGMDAFVKVLDFGIAKVLGDIGEGRSLTKTGTIVGTPEYLSPEQGESLSVDHRADIYALGVIMYEMLTGRVPFEADTFANLLAKHLFEPPVAPSKVAPDADIPPQVEAIILKALQKDRDYRFQTIGELVRAIEAVGTDAAPVEVVAEHRARPQTHGASMSYADADAPPATSTAQILPTPASTTNWRLIAVAVGALVAGISVTAVIMARGEDPAPPPPTEVAAPAPAPIEPPPPEQPPAPAPTVTVKLTTNVDAEIVDAETGAVLGRTNTDAGLTLDRSDAPLEVSLRADGYEELPLSLTLTANVTGTHELTAIKKKKNRKNKKKNDDPFSLLPVGK